MHGEQGSRGARGGRGGGGVLSACVCTLANSTATRTPRSAPPHTLPCHALCPPGTLSGWPNAGKVEYRGVTAIYRPGLPPVLRDLTFTLEVQLFVLPAWCQVSAARCVAPACCFAACLRLRLLWRHGPTAALCPGPSTRPALPAAYVRPACTCIPPPPCPACAGRRELRRGGAHRQRQVQPDADPVPPHPAHRRQHPHRCVSAGSFKIGCSIGCSIARSYV